MVGLVLGGALALWLGGQLKHCGLSHVWFLQATIAVVSAGLFVCLIGNSVEALEKLFRGWFDTGYLSVLVSVTSTFFSSINGGQFRPPRFFN